MYVDCAFKNRAINRSRLATNPRLYVPTCTFEPPTPPTAFFKHLNHICCWSARIATSSEGRDPSVSRYHTYTHTHTYTRNYCQSAYHLQADHSLLRHLSLTVWCAGVFIYWRSCPFRHSSHTHSYYGLSVFAFCLSALICANRLTAVTAACHALTEPTVFLDRACYHTPAAGGLPGGRMHHLQRTAVPHYRVLSTTQARLLSLCAGYWADV